MDRPARAPSHAARWSLALALALVVPSTGCLHLLLATGIYMFQGGNVKEAECDALEDKRVVVFCGQPASQEFRHAGASRQIAERVSDLLAVNLGKKIDVVPQRQVDAWIDENDSDDYLELGKAVKADLVVHIDLAYFELMPGQTVYQGSSDVKIGVYDVKDKGRLVWNKELGEVLYPLNAPIAAQSKSIGRFQAEYVTVLAQAIGKHFYDHDPTGDFAMDALADR